MFTWRYSRNKGTECEAKWVELLRCILEVSGSNLGSGTLFCLRFSCVSTAWPDTPGNYYKDLYLLRSWGGPVPRWPSVDLAEVVESASQRAVIMFPLATAPGVAIVGDRRRTDTSATVACAVSVPFYVLERRLLYFTVAHLAPKKRKGGARIC
jgi:hypothetical protein